MVGRFAIVLTALLVMLAGCGEPAPAPEPTARPAQLPILATPTAAQAEPPTVAARGADLPGRLVFVAGGNLWLWQGEHARQLTGDGDAFQPAWSPAGDRVAFVRRTQSASDLVVLRLEDGTKQDITQYASRQPPSSIERVYDSIWAFYPAFSPDGSKVAFSSQYGPPYGSPATDYRLTLFEMTPAPDSERSQIFADEQANIGRMAYMPDGNAILFTHTPDSPDVSSIYRYDMAAGTAERLPGVPDHSYDPAPSPDGRWLAFAVRDEQGTDVYLMPMAGGDSVRITTSGLARAPVFSPDGTRLAYIGIGEGERGFDLWVLDLDPATGLPAADAQPRRLTTDMNLDADSGLSWGV